MKPPYRASNGVYYAGSLFREERSSTAELNCPEVFSLYGDFPGLINCRRTFVELGDPTGYQWAIKYLVDWAHWNKLIKYTWFRGAYDVWLAELKTKLQSEAIQRLQEIAASGSSQATAAAKYIATFDWEKTSTKRGRPSKQELSTELKRVAAIVEAEEDDARRIGLVT
jgi:hypothetical protein